MNQNHLYFTIPYVIKRLFLSLLFLVLASSLYADRFDFKPISQDEVKTQIEEHFHQEGMENFYLTPLNTKGATHCYYFLLNFCEDMFFVKWGEKVDLEIKNQKILDPIGKLPIPPMERGTSEEKKILVRKYLKEPNFGLQQVEDFYSKILKPEDFSIFQKNVFNRLNFFYQIKKINTFARSSKLFIQRAEERLQELLNDTNLFLRKEEMDVSFSLNHTILFQTPIELITEKEHIFFPSLVEMVETFTCIFQHIPEPKFFYLIHGDCHAPNIARGGDGELFFIDLSDVKFYEDPSWDLGKWINHLNRLHNVVKIRDQEKKDSSIQMKYQNGHLVLETSISPPSEVDKVNKEAFLLFSSMIGESEELVKLRALAAGFVINLSTLRRHMLFYPIVTKRLMYCCVDSYIQFLMAYEKCAQSLGLLEN